MAFIPMANGGSTVGFPDYTNVIATQDSNWGANGVNYTATEDCWIVYELYCGVSSSSYLNVDGNRVAQYYAQSNNISKTNYSMIIGIIPVKKGSVCTSRSWGTANYVSCKLTVYGMLDY